MATLPEGVGLATPLEYVSLPTNTWIIDWTSRQVRGMDAGLDAMRQAVEIILANERFQWQIYSSNIGTELHDLPGQEEAYIESELPRRIQDAFSVDDRILAVEDFVFTRQNDALQVSFIVQTVYGAMPEVVTV